MYTKLTHDISAAATYIQQGRIVAVPTGTAYALACDALQGHALQRLRELKARPQEKTFTVFISPAQMLLYIDMSEQEQKLWEKYTGQPLTLLVTAKEPLRHLAQDGRVGLRMIDHPLMQALADAVQHPLTATSANVSGQPPAYDPQTILETFPGRLDGASHPDLAPTGDTTYNLSLAAILDGGVLPENPPTTIARVDGNQVTIIRHGALQPKLA